MTLDMSSAVLFCFVGGKGSTSIGVACHVMTMSIDYHDKHHLRQPSSPFLLSALYAFRQTEYGAQRSTCLQRELALYTASTVARGFKETHAAILATK